MSSNWAHRPPESAASTSSTSYGYGNSPSFPASFKEEESEEGSWKEPSDLSLSDEDDLDARSSDSLFEATPEEVQQRAVEFFVSPEGGRPVDQTELLKSSLFVRPPLGTEIEKEVTKQLQPKFQALIKSIDESDWMFRTPSTFVPLHKSTEAVQAADLPALSNYNKAWFDDASYLLTSTVHPLAAIDAMDDREGPEYVMGDAETELELLVSDQSSRPSYAGFGLANGQLERDVSLLGV